MEENLKYFFYKGYILKYNVPDRKNDIFLLTYINLINNEKINKLDFSCIFNNN